MAENQQELGGSEIDPEAYYQVKLNGVVTMGRAKLLPRDNHKIRGDVLLTILDQVRSFTPSKA